MNQHPFSNEHKPYQPGSYSAEPKKILTMEEKIDKIFFRTSTIEKDLAALLHANGLQSSNKYLNGN